MAKWKKWLRELIVLAVLTAVGATVIGYLRAPSFNRITSYNVCYTKLLRRCAEVTGA